MREEQKARIIELLWDSLRRDPEHEDRRQTGWGTKTKEGLIACIDRIAYELKPIEDVKGKGHIHRLRRLKYAVPTVKGRPLRYLCIDCGRNFKIATGCVIKEEASI